MEGGPEGKDWLGWSVEILDPFGRYQLSVPMAAADSTKQAAELAFGLDVPA